MISEKLEEKGTISSLLPDNTSTEELLKTLARCSGAFESVDLAMQDIVDILRERKVSGRLSAKLSCLTNCGAGAAPVNVRPFRAGTRAR